MSIKIPSGPVESKALDAAQDAAESIEGASKAAQAKGIESADTDAISSIARQVANGEITRAQAVERIMAQVLDTQMVKSAPQGMSEEIGEVLGALLETDPYLKSLAASMGPADKD